MDNNVDVGGPPAWMHESSQLPRLYVCAASALTIVERGKGEGGSCSRGVMGSPPLNYSMLSRRLPCHMRLIMPCCHLIAPCDCHCFPDAWVTCLSLAQTVGCVGVQSGVPLACPLRCAAPERIVANKAVRRLVHTLSPPPVDQPARQVYCSLTHKTSLPCKCLPAFCH